MRDAALPDMAFGNLWDNQTLKGIKQRGGKQDDWQRQPMHRAKCCKCVAACEPCRLQPQRNKQICDSG